MAPPMTADQMVSQLREYGLDVVEYRGWRRHNRNSVGAWGPVNGVMIHHSVTNGSRATVDLIYNGHSLLPGPLALGCITKDGTVYLVGNGRANHAGKGDSRVFSRVVNEDYGGRPPAPGPGDMDGNAHFYGFECENRGDGEDPWPDAQLEAIERAGAAICDWHGWREKSVIGHLEWTNQKIDPRGFTMLWMRERIKNRIGNPGTAQEDDVPHYLSLGMTKKFTLDPGEWVSIAWDSEWSDPLGQRGKDAQTFGSGIQYNGVVRVRMRGLPPGKEVQVRVVEDDLNGKHVRNLPITEGVGTAGSSFAGVPICGQVRKGRRAKVRIVHFGDAPAVVERCEIQAQIWKT